MAASGTYFIAYTFVFYLGLAHLHAAKSDVKPGVDIGMKCNKDYECRAGNGGPYSKCHRPTSTCICTVNIFGINKCEQFEDTSCHSMYKYSNMSSLECSLEDDISAYKAFPSFFQMQTMLLSGNVVNDKSTWSCYDPKRAFNTIPDGIEIRNSSVHGSGAFTNIFIKKGTVFGPCKGFLAKGDKKIASHWSWHIKEEDSVDYWFDGRHIYLSNWLRFVNMAPDVNSLNMVHFLHEGLYYYYVFRSVNPGSELLSFYSRNSTATFAKEEYDGPYFLYDGAAGYVGGYCNNSGQECENDKNSVCIGFICECKYGTHRRLDICVTDETLGGICRGSDGELCKNDINAECQRGVCVCSESSSILNGKCVPGSGVFAEEDIEKGTFVCFYEGLLLSGEEGLKRYSSEKQIVGSFLFFFRHKGQEFCIDATYSQGYGRMINDSRKPNCKVVVEQKEEIKLAFYTIKDIKKSQELRFDYNDKTAPWRKKGAVKENLYQAPGTNPFLFARVKSDTPLSGNEDLKKILDLCPGLIHPKRITSTGLRRYIATVSQILDMSESELDALARHLGHDVTTHRNNYRLYHATRELTVVSQFLTAVDNGCVNRWKGKQLKEISTEELPNIRQLLDKNNSDSDEDSDSDSIEAADQTIDCNWCETGEVVDRNQIETNDKDVGKQTVPAASSEMSDAGVDAAPLPGEASCPAPKQKDQTHSAHGTSKCGRKVPWSKTEEAFLRKTFKFYLNGTKTSVHNSDMIMAQNTCSELAMRTLAQIRSKLNNMKLGKSK